MTQASASSGATARSMSPIRLLLLLPLCAAAGCDNVGRAFDPDVDPGGPDPTTGTSAVQVVPVGGDVREGRPRIRAAYPEGAGWPGTVPIVVEFSESINADSILPTTPTGVDGRIGVRVQGSEQLLPCQYSLVAGGRFLIMRPLNALTNTNNPIYEIVLLPEARDVDGVRFQVTGGEDVLADFQVNQDSSIADGRIVALFPRDNFREQAREGDVWVVFDRPANPASLVDANVFLRPQGQGPIAVELDVPLTTVGVPDPRVLRIDPDLTLAAAANYELVVTEAITFGQSGRLDFNGRTPFADFDTVAPAAPTGVELGNFVPGFPNKINRQNVGNVTLHVTTAADTQAGDQVRARIYGGDADTPQTFDLRFVERVATVPQNGEQTVVLDFSGLLGTVAGPALDDGEIVFAAQLQRGSRTSGFVQNAASAEPTFDIELPTLTQAGPPGPGNGLDVYTDQEAIAFYGVASEPIAALTFDDGVNPTAGLFASGDSGRFLALPAPIGRLTAPRTYMLTLTDRAGNIQMPVTGTIRQRGLVTGTLAGTLTVEAYDETTLAPIQGATVLVDPVEPVVPAVGQLIGETNQNGRVAFTPPAGSHTITIVRAGYGLVTLYDSQAAFVSLPLTPNTNATATLRGTAGFTPTAGATAIVGTTAVADRSVRGIRTSATSPTEIPPIPILPNRAQVITAFGGSFEPTATPTYAFQACQLCGASLLTPTPPPAPPAAGVTLETSLQLTETGLTFGQLLTTYLEDFSLAVGLDTTSLVGGAPRVRATSSLFGFGGQVLTGVGFATNTGGDVYEIDATYSLPIIAAFAGFAPVSWIVAEAEDGAGRVSRCRVFLNAAPGSILPGVGPPAIPVVTTPGGPFSGSPAVTFVDVLDAFAVPGGLGYYDVTATDPAGRTWRMLVPDRDPAGGTVAVQFPGLVVNNVAGLVAGAWTMRVEARLFLSVTLSGVDDVVLAERFRQEINYARAAPVTFTVQ